METYCTHPHCSQPINNFPELDERSKLQTAQPKYCESCGMPQILAGRYVPLKLLGKGGFGAAYLACDLYTPKQRKCVIKQFRPPANFNPKKFVYLTLRIKIKVGVRDRGKQARIGVRDRAGFFTAETASHASCQSS
jgi:hypothetical protein